MRTLSRVLTLAAALLLTSGALAPQSATAAATVTLGTGQAGPGESAPISVQFGGDGTAVALQFDVVFDANRLAAGFAAGTALTPRHVVTSSSPSPGIARVLVYSLSNQTLGNGVIANLPMKVLNPAVVGTASLTISNVIVATAAAGRVLPVTPVAGSVLIRDSAGSRLQAPVIAANRQATIRVTGVEGKSYTLQGSTDLRAWEAVGTAVATGGVVSFTDAATRSFRFYRAVEAP